VSFLIVISRTYLMNTFCIVAYHNILVLLVSNSSWSYEEIIFLLMLSQCQKSEYLTNDGIQYSFV
jgi:hypothetical protein